MNQKEEEKILVSVLQEAKQADQELRAKFGIGEKFRFVIERLNALTQMLGENFEVKETVTVINRDEILSHEKLVYVYLYNAGGLDVQSWSSMLTPKLLTEYSVNRPAYLDKQAIHELVRSKPNRNQHAYFSVAVDSNNIIDASANDALGHPVVRAKEGAFKFERLIRFYHMDIEYRLDDGKLNPIVS